MGLAVFVLWFICWCKRNKKIVLLCRSTFLPHVLIQLLLSGHILRNPAPNSQEQNPDQFPVHLLRFLCQSQHITKTQFQLGWLLRSGWNARSFSAYCQGISDLNQEYTRSSLCPPLFGTIFREFASLEAQLLANSSYSRPCWAAVLGTKKTSYPQDKRSAKQRATSFLFLFHEANLLLPQPKWFLPWNCSLDFHSLLMIPKGSKYQGTIFWSMFYFILIKLLLYHSFLPQWRYSTSFRILALATIFFLGSHLFSSV